MVGLVVLLVTLALATVGGLAWQRRSGRFRSDRERIPAEVLTDLGVDPGSAHATLLQFSSAFCAPCRATRRVLETVTGMVPDVQHVEVDAESHLESVRALGVLRTPTVLVLDRRGHVVRRASGQPRTADVIAALGEV